MITCLPKRLGVGAAASGDRPRPGQGTQRGGESPLAAGPTGPHPLVRRALTLGCLLLLALPSRAEVKLPAIFGDHMVLQRDAPVPVWGRADPGDEITVTFGGQGKTTRAESSGAWQVTLDPLAFSAEPRDLVVQSKIGNQKSKIADVLVGEVWLCSGQSNMEMALALAADGPAEAATASHPQIRLFTVGKKSALRPQADCTGQWATCAPETAKAFSAVAFYFGRKLHSELGVPVGLINSAWGGTAAEAWIRPATLATAPSTGPQMPQLLAGRERAIALGDSPPPLKLDDTGWEQPGFADTDWDVIKLPHYWDYPLYPVEYDGVVWARRTVTIPDAWTGRKLRLGIGAVDDFETTFFNGVEVGRTTSHTLAPRVYEVPRTLVKPGPAVVAVRATKIGWGGICGKKEDMRLAPSEGEGAPIPLAGEWRWRPAQLTFRTFAPSIPGSLHDGMIAPLVPFGIRGVIWYQGEANAAPATAFNYRTTLPLLIADWRREWARGDFPFLFVQLVNFRTPTGDPNAPSDWAMLRESQLKTLAVPNTGMAVGIDVGEEADIHPKNKKAIGERLALWALAKTYGKDLVFSGPLYDGMTVEGSRVRLRFQHAAGLAARGGTPLVGFAVAGEDRRFVRAEAAIEGEAVVISCPTVPKPVAVRYAWADNPFGCNLVNGADLPASPFRTDEW